MAELVRHYIVHSCSVDPVKAMATLANGQAVEATITGLTVEMVCPDGGKTQTEAFVPEDIDAARELFAVGNEILVTYTLEKAAPPAPGVTFEAPPAEAETAPVADAQVAHVAAEPGA